MRPLPRAVALGSLTPCWCLRETMQIFGAASQLLNTWREKTQSLVSNRRMPCPPPCLTREQDSNPEVRVCVCVCEGVSRGSRTLGPEWGSQEEAPKQGHPSAGERPPPLPPSGQRSLIWKASQLCSTLPSEREMEAGDFIFHFGGERKGGLRVPIS